MRTLSGEMEDFMQYVLNAAQMKAVDSYTINQVGIDSMVLMERAALAVADVMQQCVPLPAKIISICGIGNNGGDGIAAARILAARGYEVSICMVGDMDKASSGCKKQLMTARHLGMDVSNHIRQDEYNGIIDALFGIGITREVSGDYAGAVRWMNGQNAPVVSVDIPSGIHTDTGKVCGVAVRAAHTVTFGYEKTGLLLYPGREYAGKVTVADIGFPDAAFLKKQMEFKQITYTKEDLCHMPARPADSHKGTYGKVLVIAGCEGMSGACYMAVKAAYRIGAGVVQVFTVESNRVILQTSLPEAIVSTYETEDDFSALEEYYRKATSVVLGPGIGKSGRSVRLVEKVLQLQNENVDKRLVVDADGINIIAEHSPFVKTADGNASYQLPAGCVFTPHPCELARLLARDVAAVKDDMIGSALDALSKMPGCVVVAKDACTVVAGEDTIYLNQSGCDAMATGGSGDVLSGIIGGLLAQNVPLEEAARLGVYVHGLAGENAAAKRAGYSVMSGDLIDSIGTH